MASSFLKLDLKDAGKGLVVAVLAVVLGALQQAVTAHGLDLAAYDWNNIINIALTAAGAYLAKNFFSDSSGKFGGVI